MIKRYYSKELKQVYSLLPLEGLGGEAPLFFSEKVSAVRLVI
jgi:hypothetical protein